jgi:hypothetical protein
MRLVDVDVLVSTHRLDAPRYPYYAGWFRDLLAEQRHWDIFTGLCRSAGVKGNRVPDAYLAALAIESGSEWITTDRDFSRFPGLRWRHPLQE